MALNLATGASRFITYGRSGRWSPDGQRIAFLDPGTDLVVVDRNGGSRQNLNVRDNLDGVSAFTWTAGGEIVFSRASRLYLRRGDGTIVSFDASGRDRDPHWCGTP